MSTCPVCGANVRILPSGRVVAHWKTDGSGPCPGSGQLPVLLGLRP